MTEDVKKKPSKKKKPKAEKKEVRPGYVFSVGKRKKAVARASLKPGSGRVMFNGRPLGSMDNELVKLRVSEPLFLTGEAWKRFDISVNVKGGGVNGQADAARQAIAKVLSDSLGEETKKRFLEYDRNLVVFDPRRTETHKPPHSSWGSRRYKQRSKR